MFISIISILSYNCQHKDMQTFLLVGSDKEAKDLEIDRIRKRLAVSSWNTEIISPAPTIGIDEIRRIKHILTLKPYGGLNRLIIIYEIDKATVEAQNALLKILEEPPVTTSLVLTTKNHHLLLPTITSRCQVIRIGKYMVKVRDFSGIEETFLKFYKSSPGERIMLSQNLVNSKVEAVQLLDELVELLHRLLVHPANEAPVDKINLTRQEIATLLTRAQAAKNYIERNVNYKATADVFLLGLPRTHNAPT